MMVSNILALQCKSGEKAILYIQRVSLFLIYPHDFHFLSYNFLTSPKRKVCKGTVSCTLNLIGADSVQPVMNHSIVHMQAA